ncbi:hypothetical protein ASE94_01565 [Devosia sp. Leaf64]|nr:hypothetical protein ASE94_01565 [Devosia sp. Leaf64]
MTSKHKPMLDAIEYEMAHIGSRTMSEIAQAYGITKRRWPVPSIGQASRCTADRTPRVSALRRSRPASLAATGRLQQLI